MAKLLALDWDRVEARLLVARTQGDGQVTVDQAISVPIELSSQESNLEGLHEQLSKALAGQKISKSQVLTAIGRSLIELRSMKLPPAPDEELPDMVRFQALREFSSLGAESPLDFVPLNDAATEVGEVMAAAIPGELAKQVNEAITSQGHESHRTAMRSCAAASLAMRKLAAARVGVTMIIAQQADSAELVVTKHGTVVFSRAFRLPPDWHPGETGEPLLGEVRRTIAAAQNQLGGSKVERIVLFGTDEHASLAQRLEDRTRLDVEVLNPLDGVRLDGAQPTQPERYAALVGMLQDEAHEVRPILDFANPRQRPVAESNRRTQVLLAATAATIALGIAFLVWMQFSKLDRRISKLKGGINVLKRENRKLEDSSRLFQELDTWKKADRNWLDELVHLSSSKRLTAEDFRIERINASSREGYRGTVDIQGRAKDQQSQQRLQNELADELHEVIPGGSWDERGDDRYPKAFSTMVRTNQSIPVLPVEMASNANAPAVTESTPAAPPATPDDTDQAEADVIQSESNAGQVATADKSTN